MKGAEMPGTCSTSHKPRLRAWVLATAGAMAAAVSCTQLPVNLVEDLNSDGIASRELPVDGNFDRPDAPEGSGGGAYPGELLPKSGRALAAPREGKVRLVFPGNRPDVVNHFTCEGQRFRVPPGRYRAALVLGACDRPNEQALCKFYYEGKRQIEPLKFPSWLSTSSQGPGLAPIVLPYHYRVAKGALTKQHQPCAMWSSKFELDPDRVLRSVAFTYNSRVHVFAITLVCDEWSGEHRRYKAELKESYRLLGGPVKAKREALAARAAALRGQLAGVAAPVQRRMTRQVQWAETEIEFAESLLPEDRFQLSAEENEQIEEAIGRAAEDIRALAKGKDPFAARRGLVLKSYHSDLDDTLQPYALLVPKRYTGKEPFPLIVRLHGHGWYEPFQCDPRQEEIDQASPDAITLFPHGRGSIDYMLQSEQDVLACVAEVKKDYHIDPDRVYLTGRSMGATGTWSLGAKRPDLFAGLAPVAGNADSRVWERLWGWPAPDDSPIGRVKAAVSYAIDPVRYAENLSNLPVFAIHGSDDRVVPVGHSRSMAQRVWDCASGHYFDYREPQRVSHGALEKDLLREQADWLLEQKRVRRPERVCLKTMKLHYGQAYWLKLEALQAPLQYANVTAQADEAGRVDVEVEGATALTVDLAASPAHGAAAIEVEINDTPAYQGPPPPGGKLTLVRQTDGAWQAGALLKGLAKRANLEGPIEDAFLSPFVLVYATAGPSAFDPVVAKAEAERFAGDWARLFGKPCRIKPDTAVTQTHIDTLNLVLYGGPESNRITARVMDKLPIRVRDGSVHVAGKTFTGPDVGVKLCYPNPLNPNRYVVVFAGTTWRGLYQIVNRFGNWFHWGPFDNRNWFDYAVFDDRTCSPETFLCFGFFDPRWRLDPECQWAGLEPGRQAAQPRRLPKYATVDKLPPASPDELASTRTRLYLSDLVPSLIDQHKGVVNPDMSFQGHPLCVGHTPHTRGLGLRAPSEVTFQIAGKFDRFQAEVGVDMEGAETLTKVRKDYEWIQFEVYGDDKRLYRSDWLQGDSPPAAVDAAVEGVGELRLVVNGSRARWHLGSAAWGSARVTGKGW